MGSSVSSERNNNGSNDEEDTKRSKETNRLDMQQKEAKRVDPVELGVAIAAIVGIGIVAWGLGSFLSSSSSGKRKMMKAPGKDFFIYRDDFDNDPAATFRALRKM